MFLHLHYTVPIPECIDHSVGRQNGLHGGPKLSEDPELGVSGDKQTGIPRRIPLRKMRALLNTDLRGLSDSLSHLPVLKRHWYLLAQPVLEASIARNEATPPPT